MDAAVEITELGATGLLAVVEGELDLCRAPNLRDALGDALDAGRTRITVDLSDVTFVDSTALALLAQTARRLAELDGALSVVCSDPNIVKVLALTHLDRLFAVRPTRELALRAAWGLDAAPTTAA